MVTFADCQASLARICTGTFCLGTSAAKGSSFNFLDVPDATALANIYKVMVAREDARVAARVRPPAYNLNLVLKRAALRDLLARRNLPSTGHRADLKSRLRAGDGRRALAGEPPWVPGFVDNALLEIPVAADSIQPPDVRAAAVFC